MKLSVVIPARNEAINIGRTLDELVRRLDQESIPYEIIVVDDGSSDATCAEVQSCIAAGAPVRLCPNMERHGFGYAVRKGLDLIRGEAVVIVMADGSDDPNDLVRYYHILRDESDCAFGTRFSKGGCTSNYPALKLLLNRLGNTFIRLFFALPYDDITNAFKGYRSYVIHGCRPLLSPHFNLTVELPLKAIVRGYSYSIVPTNWRGREKGSSHFFIKEMGTRYLYVVLNVWLEWMLTKGDYRRPAREVFVPWSKDP